MKGAKSLNKITAHPLLKTRILSSTSHLLTLSAQRFAADRSEQEKKTQLKYSKRCCCSTEMIKSLQENGEFYLNTKNYSQCPSRVLFNQNLKSNL